MSMGYGAFANKALEDENTVIYAYGCYNLSDDRYRNKSKISDGLLIISKACFYEPIVSRKVKRYRGHKRVVFKTILVDVPVEEMLDDKRITVENCSYCWSKNPNGFDRLALRLLFKIFVDYQKTGAIPDKVYINC